MKKGKVCCYLLTMVFFAAFQLNPAKAQSTGFYGLTENGGSSDLGSIYTTDGDGSNARIVMSFSASPGGANPRGMIYDEAMGKFIGTTLQGGAKNQGVIFEWDPGTNVYTKRTDLHDYSEYESLVSGKNGKYYGISGSGGRYNRGKIYEWDPVSGIYMSKYDFNDLSSGWYPITSMTLAGNGKFYGTTYYGGTHDDGVIFVWDPVSNNYTKLMDLDEASSGSHPRVSLTCSGDSILYGMISSSGNDYGSIFEWNINTGTYLKRLTFSAETGDPAAGSLVPNPDGWYYLATNQGIFKWQPQSNDLVHLFETTYNQEGVHNGYNLLSSFIFTEKGNVLGIARDGGYPGYGGVLFEFDPATGSYNIRISFNSNQNGSRPVSLGRAANGQVYVVTETGSTSTLESGAIFSYDPSNGSYAKVYGFPFNLPNGANPYGDLVQAENSRLYGITLHGGMYNGGVLFEWDPVTFTYSKKMDFGNERGRIYGWTKNKKIIGITTKGGLYDEGIIYELDPITLTRNIIDDIKVNVPDIGLIQAENGKFYGLSGNTIYEWDPGTKSFNPIQNLNASCPYCLESMMEASDGNFYISFGRFNIGLGEFYKLNPVNNSLQILYGVSKEDGTYPVGVPVQAGSQKLYGMMQTGGLHNCGVIYEWDFGTNKYAVRYNFDTLSGIIPLGSLYVGSDDKLYGTTSRGGLNGYGTLFQFNPRTGEFIKKFDFDSTYGDGSYYRLTQINKTVAINPDLTTGLIAYYPFEGNTDDKSGNGHHGTSLGGTLTKDRFDKSNGAYHFNGENNTLSFSGYTLQHPYLTVCGWVKITDEFEDTVLYSTGSILSIAIKVVNHRYQAELSVPGKKITLADGTGKFDIDIGHPRYDFLLLSYDGTEIKFFINGELAVTSDLNERSLLPWFPMTFNQDIRYSFKGILDEARIYCCNFTDEEIRLMYSDTYRTTPDLTTDSVTNILRNSATIHGTLHFTRGKDIFTLGAVYGLVPNVDTTNHEWIDHLFYNDTVFSITLENLLPGKTYHVRMIAMKISGISYYNELTFKTLPAIPYGFVTDVQGNKYKTVLIGRQRWMAENLRTTKFRNGNRITHTADAQDWSNTMGECYCWYLNDSTGKIPFGALYNRKTVQNDDLCPSGWHIPSNNEWYELEDYEGGYNIAGAKLKEAGTSLWIPENTGATDENGFSGVPGGMRNSDGSFTGMGDYSGMWISGDRACVQILSGNNNEFLGSCGPDQEGHSVRCIENQGGTEEGLLAYYPFNGNAHDESGNGHDGAVYGAELAPDRFGNENNAYLFRETDFISLENTSAYNLFNGFALAAWVKLSPGSNGPIISKHIHPSNNGFAMAANNNHISLSTNSDQFLVSTNEIDSDGTWHFVLGTLNGHLLSVYVDGLPRGTQIVEYTVGNSINIRIGSDSTTSFFEASIDDVRIFNHTLNQDEVVTLYHQVPPARVSTPVIKSPPQSLFMMPVTGENLNSINNIVSYQFRLNFDSTYIRFAEIDRDSTLSENGNMEINPQEDHINIAWAGQFSLPDSGILVKLLFEAVKTGQTSIEITNFLLNADTLKNIQNGAIFIDRSFVGQSKPANINQASYRPVEIFPNPANTIIYFRNLQGKNRISIFDMTGRLWFASEITDNQIDISSLTKGMYNVVIQHEKSIINQKLVKL